MTDNLQKALHILTSNPLALEALVEAMEACLEGKQYDGSGDSLKAAVEAEIKPKHPLEDYKITEKDVGSLVLFGDNGHVDILTGHGTDSHWPFETADDSYSYAEPHLDPIALHFKPFYATPDSVAPDDLGEHFAVLFNDGDVVLAQGFECVTFWRHYGDVGEEYIIGYRPLKFVNPLRS